MKQNHELIPFTASSEHMPGLIAAIQTYAVAAGVELGYVGVLKQTEIARDIIDDKPEVNLITKVFDPISGKQIPIITFETIANDPNEYASNSRKGLPLKTSNALMGVSSYHGRLYLNEEFYYFDSTQREIQNGKPLGLNAESLAVVISLLKQKQIFVDGIGEKSLAYLNDVSKRVEEEFQQVDNRGANL